MGATALNYTQAVDLLTKKGRVTGVQARDAIGETSYCFQVDRVVNAAGPWSPKVARHFDQDVAELCGSLSAWNVLFNREAPTDCAVGARPRGSESQHYFLHPWKGRLLIGTGHSARKGEEVSPHPSPDEMAAFLDDVNQAFPGLKLTRDEILHVYSGLLPAKHKNSTTLTKTDRWVDHGAHGGPDGLFSVQGTKFTAARATAEEGMARIFPNRTVSDENVEVFQSRSQKHWQPRGVFDYHWEPDPDDLTWKRELAQIVREEAVVHLDDLILRRTSLGDNPHRALRIAPELCDLFEWTEERCREEIRRVEAHFSSVQHSSTLTDKNT